MVVQGLQRIGCLKLCLRHCNCQWGSHCLPWANIDNLHGLNNFCDDTAWQLAFYIWLHKFPIPEAWDKILRACGLKNNRWNQPLVLVFLHFTLQRWQSSASEMSFSCLCTDCLMQWWHKCIYPAIKTIYFDNRWVREVII